MTDTIKISRELLEQICVELEHDKDRYMLGRELRKALATPPADAADMGGQAGEEVEVMAYAVDHPEAGYKVYKQFSQWMNGGEWRCDSLMTVAQHQRIVAALSAQQSAHVSVPRDIAMALLDDGPRAETWKAQAALRALLNGGEA